MDSPEIFAPRTSEKVNIVAVCRYTAYLDGVSDETLMKQVNVYLKRLQPILKAAILAAKDNQIDSRLILRQFMIESVRSNSRFYALHNNEFSTRPK